MITQEFDRILDFCIGNALVYNDICREIIKGSNDSGIMPFIGTGLTEFTFGNSKDFINNVLNVINNTLSDEQLRNIQIK